MNVIVKCITLRLFQTIFISSDLDRTILLKFRLFSSCVLFDVIASVKIEFESLANKLSFLMKVKF